MALSRLAYLSVWPATGGHYANQLAGEMELFGEYSPDTASTELAPLQVTFTVPNVSDPLVSVRLSNDVFTNSGGNAEHGYYMLYQAGVLVEDSRKRMTSGGPNNKRRVMYEHVLSGLTGGASVTLAWRWEGTNADDVRANQADDGFTRNMIEVWDVSAPAVAAGGGRQRSKRRGRRAITMLS